MLQSTVMKLDLARKYYSVLSLYGKPYSCLLSHSSPRSESILPLVLHSNITDMEKKKGRSTEISFPLVQKTSILTKHPEVCMT